MERAPTAPHLRDPPDHRPGVVLIRRRTPGDLGVYGFRNRADHSYDNLFIANSTAIKEPRLWDLATRAGKPSIVLGVPGTYPPRPLNGVMVSCFLTPTIDSQYTFPPMLKREIEQTSQYLLTCEMPHGRQGYCPAGDERTDGASTSPSTCRHKAVGALAMSRWDDRCTTFWKMMAPGTAASAREPSSTRSSSTQARGRLMSASERADDDTAISRLGPRWEADGGGSASTGRAGGHPAAHRARLRHAAAQAGSMGEDCRCGEAGTTRASSSTSPDASRRDDPAGGLRRVRASCERLRRSGRERRGARHTRPRARARIPEVQGVAPD